MWSGPSNNFASYQSSHISKIGEQNEKLQRFLFATLCKYGAIYRFGDMQRSVDVVLLGQDGTKRCIPEIFTKKFHGHLEMHQKACLDQSNPPASHPLHCKDQTTYAAAAAIVYVNFSLNLVLQKSGFMSLVETLIKIEVLYLAESCIDMYSLLSMDTAVQESVKCLLEKRKKE